MINQVSKPSMSSVSIRSIVTAAQLQICGDMSLKKKTRDNKKTNLLSEKSTHTVTDSAHTGKRERHSSILAHIFSLAEQNSFSETTWPIQSCYVNICEKQTWNFLHPQTFWWIITTTSIQLLLINICILSTHSNRMLRLVYELLNSKALN